MMVLSMLCAVIVTGADEMVADEQFYRYSTAYKSPEYPAWGYGKYSSASHQKQTCKSSCLKESANGA